MLIYSILHNYDYNKNHLSLTVFGFHLNWKIKPLREGGEKDTSSQREWLFDNETKEQRRTEDAAQPK